MNIRIQWLAQLRTLSGQTEETVDVDSTCSLAELICRVADSHGDPLREYLITEGGHIRPSLLLIVNDQTISSSTAASMALNDNDTVCLLPPISGG
jgi:molybdopterin converting factor small subunit